MPQNRLSPTSPGFHRPISPQRFFLALLLSNLAVLVLNHSVLAEPLSSTDIAPGVVFHTYRLTMPNDVFVLQIERDRPEYEFRVGWPGNERNYAVRSSTTAIISAAEQAGMNVIGAVNASFFEFDNINVTGLTASSGQIVHPPSGSYETAIIGTDRQGTILEDVTNQVSTLTFASGNTITLNAFNQIHTAGQLTLYTDNWGKVEHTMGANAVAYVIDKLSAPPRAKREFVGRITAKVTGDNANNYPVPVGGAVLLGDAGINMLRTVAVGQELQFNIGASVNTLNNLDIALTGVGRIMHNGARDTVNWSQYKFGNVRHPRTVWAWNDDYWFLMVVDGRSERSVGMTFAEMADFLEEELSATDALNLDGGGSSTMVVDGAVRNAPSDGQQRPVANALLLIATTPTTTSLPFADDFAASERRGEWDDKFTFNAPTTETTPSGDDAALLVQDPSGGVETVRAGEWGDCNYAIQADVLCENRSDEAASGYERYALFARDPVARVGTDGRRRIPGAADGVGISQRYAASAR